MADSSVVDLRSPTANMYGCEPCPKCGSRYRCVFMNAPEFIQCDDCGFNESITEKRGNDVPVPVFPSPPGDGGRG